MNKKSGMNLIVGIFIIFALITAYIFGDKISLNNTGNAYEVERIIRAIIVACIAYVIIKTIFLSMLKPVEDKRGKSVPRLLKDAIGFVIWAIAAAEVLSLYNSSPTAIIGVLGGGGIVLGFGLQDLIKEVIAGFTIDIQNDFRIGDWIKFPDGKVGKILETDLTGVTLTLEDGTQLYVSNTAMTNQAIVDLSQPQRAFYIMVTVVLGHDVPVDRARRILYAATITAEGVHNQSASVVAKSAEAAGIVYEIYFMIPDYDVWLEVRHQVISSITKRLHKHSLKICSIRGELKLHNVNKIPDVFDDSMVTNELSTLRLSGLLKGCADDVQEQFAKNMTKLQFKQGEKIVSQGDIGDTMFIIAEGVVEVFMSVSADENGEIKTSSNTVAHLSDGDYFGEMALLKGEPRGATITAKTDVVLYEVHRETVKSFIKEYQDFADKISIAIVERYNEDEKVRISAVKNLNKAEEVEKTATRFMDAFKSFLGI